MLAFPVATSKPIGMRPVNRTADTPPAPSSALTPVPHRGLMPRRPSQPSGLAARGHPARPALLLRYRGPEGLTEFERS